MTTTTPTPDLTERVTALEQDALAQLDRLLAGTAMCRVDGTHRGAKHWEGRAAALAQVRRSLRRAQDPGGVPAAVLAEWSAQTATTRGPAWQEYTAGGLEALTELR